MNDYNRRWKKNVFNFLLTSSLTSQFFRSFFLSLSLPRSISMYISLFLFTHSLYNAFLLPLLLEPFCWKNQQNKQTKIIISLFENETKNELKEEKNWNSLEWMTSERKNENIYQFKIVLDPSTRSYFLQLYCWNVMRVVERNKCVLHVFVLSTILFRVAGFTIKKYLIKSSLFSWINHSQNFSYRELCI